MAGGGGGVTMMIKVFFSHLLDDPVAATTAALLSTLPLAVDRLKGEIKWKTVLHCFFVDGRYITIVLASYDSYSSLVLANEEEGSGGLPLFYVISKSV